MNIRRLVPARFRLLYTLIRRQQTDKKYGYSALFASAGKSERDFLHDISTKQPVKKSQFAANKVHNLKLASASVETCIIQPGQIFSFWHIIGSPSRRNGFKEGRNIVNGVLKKGYGGGLCQLSGIIYHLSLMAGLEVIERHHHSADIYKEAERFCPLGSDATVVFGYKDLRIKNTLQAPIRFSFQINDKEVEGRLECAVPIQKQALLFDRTDKVNTREVRTHVAGEEVAFSVYKVLNT